MDKPVQSKHPNTTQVERLVSFKACKTNNTRQGPVSPLRSLSGVWYELHMQFFTTRDDIQRFYCSDKHILPDRKPDTNELLMTQERELGMELYIYICLLYFASTELNNQIRGSVNK